MKVASTITCEGDKCCKCSVPGDRCDNGSAQSQRSHRQHVKNETTREGVCERGLSARGHDKHYYRNGFVTSCVRLHVRLQMQDLQPARECCYEKRMPEEVRIVSCDGRSRWCLQAFSVKLRCLTCCVSRSVVLTHASCRLRFLLSLYGVDEVLSLKCTCESLMCLSSSSFGVFG